ncbi:MAG: DUF2807 domain-containing protein [Planctomycetota bacterium]|nr:DUF2807 domain-containing protein [Planctomycetota bacterium]
MRIVPAHLAAAAALLATSCVFVVSDHDDCGSDWALSAPSPEHTGSGTAAREERTVAEFTRLEAGGAIHVDLRIGSPRSVAVLADDNLLGHVITEVGDGTLRLTMRPGSYETRTPIRVEVVNPTLTTLVVGGAAHAAVAGLDGGSLKVSATGAGRAELAGRVDLLTGAASGAAEVRAFGLDAARVDVDVQGAGEVEVLVREELEADVSGAGKVRYRGNPPRLRTESSGAGSVTGP